MDTHVALWADQRPQRLGPESRRRLETDERICFSSISGLELAIKRLNGRLNIPADVHVRFQEIGMEELPFRSAHAVELESFPELIGHDPFDRALLAQAKAERCDFVTADRRILALGITWVLDATA